MDRRVCLSILVFALLLGGWPGAAAQDLSIAGSAAGNVVKKKLPGKFHLYITESPTHSSDSGAVYTNGQIFNFGGPLQYYANAVHTAALSDDKLPFGGNVVLPLASGRTELFAGMGGVFVPFQTLYARPDTWLTQVNLGARVALDPEHHFWLGTSASYLTNFWEQPRTSLSKAADFTIRFGR